MAIKFLSNESIDGTLEVGSFTVSGSGIVAAVGMTLQVDAGGVNAITIDNVGTVTTSGYLKIPNYLFHDGDTDTRLQFGTGTITLRGDSGITLDGPVTTNAAFNLTGGIITLGVADTSSGHINAYENLTFNIDIDNDDTNRYFGFYTNGSDGSGTELVRIAEDGNVAIQPGGATLTNTRLYVVSADNYDPSLYDGMGGIRIGSGGGSSAGDGNYTGGIGFAITSGTSGIAGVQKGADADKQGLAFFTHPSNTGGDAAVEKMRLDADGNVGIGTTSPQSKLDLLQPDSSANTLGQSVTASLGIRMANAVGQVGQIVFNNDAAPSYGYGSIGMIMTSGTGVGLGDMIFSTKSTGSDSASTERMRIDSNGVIQLTSGINGYLNTNSIGMEIDINRNPETGAFTDAGLSHARIIMRGDTTANGGSNIKFVTSPTVNTVGTTKMTITGAGDVGIGTTSPGAKLDVNGAGSTGTITWANDGGRKRGYLYSDSAGVAIYSTALQTAGIYLADSSQIDFRLGGSVKMLLNNSGNLGLGTTTLGVISGACSAMTFGSTHNALSGGVMFQANGTIKNSIYWESDNTRYQNVGDFSHTFYKNNTTVLFTIATTGTVTAVGDVVAYSDKKLKKNIKTLDGSKVYKMRGVEFIKDGKQSSGVIAQELEKIAPELVNSDSEYKSVAYGNISGYLIEAIKELKAEIEELKLNNCNCK